MAALTEQRSALGCWGCCSEPSLPQQLLDMLTFCFLDMHLRHALDCIDNAERDSFVMRDLLNARPVSQELLETGDS